MDDDFSALKKQQANLAQLLTKPLQQLQTTDAHLAFIAPEQLLEHRETLIRKRSLQTAEILPRVRRGLGEQFEPLFRDFANQHHFNSVDANRLDAIHFTRWLEQKSLSIPWLSCCCRFERTRCEWEKANTWYCRFILLKYDIHSWETTADSPNKKATAWLFANSGSLHRVWHWPRRNLNR
jgi:hypothetical protein